MRQRRRASRRQRLSRPGPPPPWHGCRSVEVFADDARLDLDGERIDLSAYIAAAFRFGQVRETSDGSSTRIVLEASRETADEPFLRVSLSPGEALRLARAITRLVEETSLPTRVA